MNKYPCVFLIFHQVVGKPFKFTNNVLQTNKNFLNESNFRSSLSLSLCIHSVNRQAYINILLTFINIFSYLVRNNTAKI